MTGSPATFIDILGARLEARWVGPPPESAPTLVFLHEGLGSADQWRDLPDVLSTASGCGALVYSRAGYGRSSPIHGPRPVEFMHDEARNVLPAILGRFGVRRPVLFGHSDGASIALIYAGSGCRPEPLGLVLEAPHVLVEPVCLASIADLARRFESPDTAGGELRQRFARRHGERSEDTVRGWVDVWLRPEFAAWNIEALLPAIRCPVLAIQGADDAYGTVLQLASLHAGANGPVTLRLLADCGHTPHRDRREAVLSLALEFLTPLKG